MNKKEEIRKNIKSIRENQTDEYVRSQSEKIAANFFGCCLFDDSELFLLYSDFKNEVQTDQIISGLIRQNKKVYLPKTIGREMVALPYSDKMETGGFGISEPLMEVDKIIPASDFDVVVVPGIAFDLCGGRIGFGKGYYDRFLDSVSNGCKTVALAYEFQIVPSVFSEVHDVKMDYIFLPDKIVKVKK